MRWYFILVIVIASLIGFYLSFLVLMTLEAPQRHVLYLHKIRFPWFASLWKPQTLGYSAERVNPFILDTPDGEQIFAWHILPIDKEISGTLMDEHLDVLRKDTSARVIIYCTPFTKETSLTATVHGTASHLAQDTRLDTYRLLAASNPNTHVLVVDYRGWGYSSGTPSENGIISDGLTVLDWVLTTAQVDPSNVLLVSQSLGTGIAMGVATEYHVVHSDRPLAGIVTIAAFTSLRSLVGAYRMGGILPLLGPLHCLPNVSDFFVRTFLRAQFDSGERMKKLVEMTEGTRFSITLVHATDDWEIPHIHSRRLFEIACNGNINIKETIMSNQVLREIEDGRIRYIESSWGGHNDLQKGDSVLKAVMTAWH